MCDITMMRMRKQLVVVAGVAVHLTISVDVASSEDVGLAEDYWRLNDEIRDLFKNSKSYFMN